MFTHAELYSDDELPSQSTRYPKSVTDRVRVPRRIRRFGGKFARKKEDEEVASETSNAPDNGTLSRVESEEEEEVPQMNMIMVVVVLVIDTVIVGVTAEFLVSSINVGPCWIPGWSMLIFGIGTNSGSPVIESGMGRPGTASNCSCWSSRRLTSRLATLLSTSRP
jgi:hypothetical protein